MKSQKIETIRKRFHREWLLIAVDKIDKMTTTPLTGRLIAHSKDRDEIYNKLLGLKRIREIPFITYSEDRLPKGYAVAFLCLSFR